MPVRLRSLARRAAARPALRAFAPAAGRVIVIRDHTPGPGSGRPCFESTRDRAEAGSPNGPRSPSHPARAWPARDHRVTVTGPAVTVTYLINVPKSHLHCEAAPELASSHHAFQHVFKSQLQFFF
jgi:hypothetical protein